LAGEMNRYSYVTGSYQKKPYIEKVIHTASIEPPQIEESIREQIDEYIRYLSATLVYKGLIDTTSSEPPEITIRQMVDDFEQRTLDQVKSNIDEYIDNINRSQFEDNNG
jgi:hypothetical protein